MATIFFVKRGKAQGQERRILSFLVDLRKIIATFPLHKPTWSGDELPTIDPKHVTSDVEAYRSVVVKVELNEACHPYAKAGHYLLDARPLEVASKLGLEV
ncbi:hypothetical protein DyAD56_07840 [Dyella sp. AD56]|uniref:hypothetical protein n=1 Tax=Dyella sp. AD56 TaxID=1528744 RepID=UPI000C83FCDF|nr:hypothetical protein [Dyella sp. AD56]PMQ05798.1 hypothetical protein DyAD56_07840 [Dyella sp. AD56]